MAKGIHIDLTIFRIERLFCFTYRLKELTDIFLRLLESLLSIVNTILERLHCCFTITINLHRLHLCLQIIQSSLISFDNWMVCYTTINGCITSSLSKVLCNRRTVKEITLIIPDGIQIFAVGFIHILRDRKTSAILARKIVYRIFKLSLSKSTSI